MTSGAGMDTDAGGRAKETADDDGRALHAYVHSRRGEIERQLAEWIRIPGVLGEPGKRQDLVHSAHWLAGAFRELGFPGVEVLPTGDSCAIYAEWCAAPGMPTVLVYSHHDVRSAKPENWEQTAPFEPVVREQRMYGRGSSDAKGQILAHLEGLRAHLRARARTDGEPSTPGVNLKFLIEGEEEGGSPHLAQLLEQQGERFAADVVLFTDTLLWREDFPARCVSLRGMLSVKLEVFGPERDVHSGAVSGIAPNPVFELSRLLAQLHDSSGRIAVPGFYDDAEPPPEDLRRAFAALPYSDEDFLRRSEIGAITGEEGYTVLERLWLRPAVEVTAMIAGDPLGVSRAAVPSVATADLSFRTVPGQRVEQVARQVGQWVEATIGGAFRHTVTPDLDTAQEPYRTPDHPAVGILEQAMARGFRTETVGRMGNAGGGPATLLSGSLQAPVLFFGTGLVEDHWHDSDESVSLEVLHNGAVTLACFWDGLAGMDQGKDKGNGHFPG